MHEERTLAAVTRAQQSVNSAAAAYNQSLRRIRASRFLLATPVWTAQSRAEWQGRPGDESLRTLEAV